MHIFRCKSYERLMEEAKDNQHLLKALGALDITLLGLGIIIGTGIFVLTGIGAAEYAGPGLMLSFVLAAVTCAFICLAYAELASFLPAAGSTYTYAYSSLGELFGWWVGWSLILEYSVGASAVAGGWSAYFSGILHAAGLDLPRQLIMVPAEGGWVNLPAVLIVVVSTVLLIFGVQASAKINRLLVFIKLGTIFLFLFLAAPHINPLHWKPFLPFGVKGVVAGTAVLFFAYLGVDALATTAEEAKNPKRDMPIGILSALLLCTILYIAVCAVMTGVVPYPQLDTAAPASFVLEYIGLRFGSAIVGTGAICGLSTVILGMLFAQSRALYAMSRDGLIPMRLYKVHPRFRSPYIIQLLVGGVVAIITGFTPIHIVAEVCSAGTIFAFLCACVGILILRKRYPNKPRGFRCPAVKVIAPLGFIFCGFIFSQLSSYTMILFCVWTLIGFVVYGLYGYRHSELRKEEQ
ncbi:amino acid permease [Megasphaera hutchinsoni]|uniref:Amino acid permease n=1 Tax=Megasphaera hutchinsoni TaxID=1588748 RepID=A0A2J8BBX2_9FIRM|nr:amino acid permease [Megasphaera genomosp. type_2]MUP59063.1 amino acid permease [Veillonellaceae bacterium M2-4]PNH22246.1 amino acid permease [Megasphaera genomosp. type_2]